MIHSLPTDTDHLNRMLTNPSHEQNKQKLESSEIESIVTTLVKTREILRSKNHYTLADKLRSGLEKIGLILKDTPKGTKWTLESN